MKYWGFGTSLLHRYSCDQWHIIDVTVTSGTSVLHCCNWCNLHSLNTYMYVCRLYQLQLCNQ